MDGTTLFGLFVVVMIVLGFLSDTHGRRPPAPDESAPPESEWSAILHHRRPH